MAFGALALIVLVAPMFARAGTYRYVSPKGSDRDACTRLKPCKTFDRAYRQARPGQTVIVLGGAYRNQVIGLDWKKRSTRRVLFRPARGRRVVIRGSLKVLARYIELRGFHVGTWGAVSPAAHVTFRSVTAGRFVVAGASDVSVVGGTLGPWNNVPNIITAKSTSSMHPPRDLLLDRVTVHGYRSASGADPVSCLEVRTVNGLTVRRSRFLDCEASALFFEQAGFAGPPANVIVENNVFGRTGRYAIYLDGSRSERWFNFLVRNNSTDGAIGVAPESDPLLGLDFYSNIAASFTGCGRPGVSVDANVWETGSVCGSNDAVAPSGFTDPDAGNYDLLPGSAAIDRSPAGSFASSDISGQARPIGSGGDSGAYESGASGLVAAYSFNEHGGAFAGDSAGNGNTGIVSGPVWTTSGRFAGALFFDGVDDWVTIADAPSLDMTGNLTLEAWVKPSSLGTTWRTVALKEQPGNLVYALYANTDDRGASGHIYVGGDMDARAPSRLPLGQWSHIATTYDGGTLRLYVNGSEVTRRSVAGGLVTSSGPLRLGGNAVWNEWFAGDMDEVRLYSRPLSGGQIKKDMSKRILSSSVATTPDNEAPSLPSGLAVTGQTQTALTLSWNASTDNVGLSGYGVYRNGTSMGSTAAGTRAYTFSGLVCGTAYTLAVDAFDAAGNRSAQASLSGSTAACTPPDTSPPTVPTGLTQTLATTTSITISWTASTDDTGVTGYGVYRDGPEVRSTTQITYTFTGLVCGVNYTLAVDAFDATGNRSARASLGASTASCPVPGAADLHLAPSGSDANPCSQAAPCRSFDRAYRVAQPGDLVEVAGGTYGDQDVRYDSAKTSATDVVFQPASGANVTVNGDLVIGPDRFTRGASHVTFKNMTLSGDVQVIGCGASSDGVQCQPSSSAGGDDVTFQDLTVRGPYAFYCASCSNVSIVGGVWGPATYQCRSGFGSAHPEVQNAYQKLKRSRGILIEGATFQNFARCTSSDHTECMQMEPADDVTIRGSTFRRCDTIVVNFANDLAFDSKSAAGYEAPNNILIENNFFDESADNTGGPTWYALNIRECTNCTVRYNSWLQAPRMPTGQISLNNRFIGNVGPMGQANCGVSGVTYSYNVWSDASCSSTDLKTSNLGFVDVTPGSFDLHLKATSAAINRGDPGNYPSRDIDGQSRPLGGAPDAGADERS